MATQANPFDQFDAPAPSAPVYGAPPKVEQPGPFDAAKDARDAQRLSIEQDRAKRDAIKDQQEQADKEAKLKGAKDSAVMSMTNVLDKLDTIGGKVSAGDGWWQTGKSGALVRSLPTVMQSGTGAYDLQKQIDTVDANTAFDALQQMRQNSPTGGALGNVSDQDMRLLKAKIASLDPNQSQEQFQANLKDAREYYLQMLGKIDPEAAAAYQKNHATNEDQGQEGLTGEVTYDPSEWKDGKYVGPQGGGDQPPPENRVTGNDPGYQQIAAGVGDLVQGAGDVVGIVSNPLNATINAATGSHLNTDLGAYLREQSGLPHGDPTIETINRMGVGAFLPALGAGKLAGMIGPGGGGGGGGVIANALRDYGARPLTDLAGGAGAGAGGEYAKDKGYGVAGQLGGMLLGGGLAGGVAGMATGARDAATTATRAATPASEVMAAADRRGITMLPADVGGTGTKMATGAVSNTLGGIPLAEGAKAAIASGAKARDEVASMVGRAADDTGAGQAAQRGAQSFLGASEKRGAQLYEKVSVPNEKLAVLDNTRAALGDAIQGMKSNPELSKIWTGNERLRASLEALTPTDTRQAGAVRLRAAEDKLTKAEAELARTHEKATTELNFAQGEGRRAIDSAQTGYAEATATAQSELQAAKDAYDALAAKAQRSRLILDPQEKVSPAELSAAHDALNQASRKYQAFADMDRQNPDVAKALRPVDDAHATYNSARYQEPNSKELDAAREAVANAKRERDEAFIEARQPPQGGQLSWGDMKRLRTIVGQIVGRPSLSSEGSDVAAMRRLYGALSEDMRATAEATSPRALTEFNRANQYWRGRESRINEVISGILGKDSTKNEEAAFQQINRWAQAKGGDFQKLSQAMRSMPADEAETVRASIIGRMGNASAGRQNADGNVFSPAEFVTQWNNLSGRAKSVLFPDAEHRAALNDLAKVFSAMKGAQQYQNTSKTALSVNAFGHGMTALSGIPGAILAATAGASSFGLGKLLASPKFARWLARSVNVRETAAPAYVGKLSNLFPSGSVLSADARGLQEQLMQAMSQSPVRAAATPIRQDKQD